MIWLLLLVGAGFAVLLAGCLDRWAYDNQPRYRSAWQRAFGEFQPERQHVRLVTSPAPMRCCRGIGHHLQGCGFLDQRDSGET